MTDRPTPPPSEDGDLAQLLRRLEARVSWLEVEGVRLLDAVAEEIQTRRVVVVDDDGRERIVLGAHERFAHVTVHARPSARDSTSVELFANDPADGRACTVDRKSTRLNS